MLGVDVTRLAEPDASKYFLSPPAEIPKSRRNFMLFPINFQPPAAVAAQTPSFSTDQVLVYLLEATSTKRFNLFPATMLLMWRPPGISQPVAAQPATAGNTLELEDFKQNDPSAGYVTVKYNLLTGQGRLRLKVYDAANPASADWFTTRPVEVKAGRGVQLIDIKVEADSKSPTDLFKAGTIEVELLDLAGKVLAKVSKQLPMTWAKPK
mgnify:FL=1